MGHATGELAALAPPKANAYARAAFSNCEPVFGYRPGRPSEFIQAGIESFGRADREAADAEILSLALTAAMRTPSEGAVTGYRARGGRGITRTRGNRGSTRARSFSLRYVQT
jgi:hypothetical protein